MKEWRTWTLYEWAEALLAHYFSLASSTEPVEALVVVGDELARVVNESVADPAEVEDLLIRKVLRGVGENGFWSHAEQLAPSVKPYYLAHLAVACLAATDLDDGDEDSYIARLESMTHPTRGDLSLQIMADLWRRLAAWLKERPDEYRSLVLPDPGGWTRIGYTVRLAFPSRHDQRALARCLSTDGLLVRDPPVGLVINRVSSMGKAEFSKRFRSEFDTFRRQRETGAAQSELRRSPFWSAVRAASTVDIGDRADSVGWALLASDDGYDLDLTLVSDGETNVDGLATVELAEPTGRWTRQATADGSKDEAVAGLFSGRYLVPGLSELIGGGLIPLVEGLHGELESSGHRESLPDAHAVLVADRLVGDVLSRFGSRRAKRRPCEVQGWSFVDGVSLTVSSSEELERTPLEGCWILHESPSPTVIRIVGGVRVGSAWLGAKDLLPEIQVLGAKSVTADVNGGTVKLHSSQEGIWALPSDTYDGSVQIIGDLDGQLLRRQLDFVRTPAAEAFRAPASVESWVYEDQARARSFRERWVDGTSEIAYISDAQRTTYLGRDVGVFVDSPALAAWAIVDFGSTRIVSALIPLSETLPLGQVPEARARRRWRKYLTPGNETVCRAEVVGTLRHIVSTAGLNLVPLAVAANGKRPTPASRTATPHPRLDEVVAAVTAISNRRAGFERRWLTHLFSDVITVEPKASSRIVRAWQEAGLLDEVVNIRWSGRRLLGVPPHFQVFRVDAGFRATLCGLALATTIADVKSHLDERGIAVSPVECRSPFVPQTIMLQAESMVQIEEVARTARLDVHLVGTDPFVAHTGRDLHGDPPAVGYINEPALPIGQGSVVQRRWRKGGPSLWTVRAGDLATWTHFLESARFWAQAFSGIIEVELTDPADFTLESCFLPLTSARWLSTVAGARSGPAGPGAEEPYLYGAPTAALRTRFLDGLKQFANHNVASMRNSSGGH